MHLKISGVDMVLVHNHGKELSNQRSGYIVYNSNPEQSFRDKARDVISFVLGRPLIYLGFTTFCEKWYPIFTKSITAFSIDGKMFRLHSLPPYPIFVQNTRNVLDGGQVDRVVNSIVKDYDVLDFQRLSWAYWHAMCAPYHIEAAHFGAVIEKLQDTAYRNFLDKADIALLERARWRNLRKKIFALIAAEELDAGARDIICSNISTSNKIPQKLLLKRLLEKLGVPIGELEFEAWNQRNDAAHGTMSDQYRSIILNGKILRIIFHRMVASVTKCSVTYIDYYSLHFPDRDLGEAIPRRLDHPKR